MPKKSRFIFYKGWKFPPTAAGVQEKLYRMLYDKSGIVATKIKYQGRLMLLVPMDEIQFKFVNMTHFRQEFHTRPINDGISPYFYINKRKYLKIVVNRPKPKLRIKRR